MKNPTILNKRLIKDFKKLNQLIRNARGVIIAGHISPDGDDISSQLALGEYCKIIGKKFLIAWCEDIPKSFLFLPNTSLITNINGASIDLTEYDLFIVVDSGDIDRIGSIKDLIKPEHTLVNIDHHKGNTRFGALNIVHDKACSIGELLYYFFQINKIKITYNIAVNLYISIVTDTGSFRYDSMHHEVHTIAADLLSKGVVPSDFNIALTQNKTLPYIKLLTLLLSRLELFENGKIAVSYLHAGDFEPKQDETDGLIEYLGILETVSVYLLIKEKAAGFFTASLRSKFHVDVAKVASDFKGGGHMRAAGCKTSDLSFDEFKKQLVSKVTEQL